MTQAILFDVDGVLIHGYHAREELRHYWDKDIDHDIGLNRQKFCALFSSPLWMSILTGQTGLHQGLAEYLPTCDYHDDPQIVIDYWLKNDSNINHALFEKIKILKSSPHVSLYIATNQEHDRARYLMEVLGFKDYFIDIFHSAKIGFTKPSQEYYDRVQAALGNSNTPPIFFDDTPQVIEGAKNFGWKAYEFLSVQDLYKDDFVSSLLG